MLFKCVSFAHRIHIIKIPQFWRSYPHDIASAQNIGKLQSIQEKCYDPGQLVINRLFGCRGMVMKSWNAKLVDKNFALGDFDSSKKSDTVDQSQSESDLEALVNPPYPKQNICGYTLLLDIMDATSCNFYHVGSTYIPDPDLRGEIRTERGLDYAFHDDLIPYTSSSLFPLTNPILMDLFTYDSENRKYLPTELVDEFIRSVKPAFDIKTVYRQTSYGVRVTVVPFYIGTIDSEFYWRYVVRIENLTMESLTLRERFWKIYSMKGKLETISGKGVIGMEPVLSTNTPVFQYHSHTVTKIPSTYMWGIFRFQKPSGATVDVRIPHVALKHEPREESLLDKVPETEPEPSDK